MDKHFQDWDVEQGWLFPPSVLDLVPANHPAHFVREPARSELELSAIFGDYACEMRVRFRRGGHRSRYGMREQRVEPVFGQIKEARGFRQFLMRGWEKVRCEWDRLCNAHGLNKLIEAIA